jgi:hypothetical protein
MNEGEKAVREGGVGYRIGTRVLGGAVAVRVGPTIPTSMEALLSTAEAREHVFHVLAAIAEIELRDHDQADEADEACPVYRPGENGFQWQCVLGMAHNNPDRDPDYDDQQTVHIDQFGNEFRVARCQQPQEHGMPHCWCAIPGHHKPLEPGPCRCGHLYRVHNAVMSGGTRGCCTECRAGECPRYEPASPEPVAAPAYLLGCRCQVTPANGATAGAPYVCAVHGDTTVTMVIPLPAATPEASS